jgi:hypothetical protein
MVVLTASLRAQTTFFNSPGNTIVLPNTTFAGNVEIKALTTVVIPAGITVKMNKNNYILIEKGGGKLIVNGTITSNSTNPDIDKWEGIYVEGDESQSQPALSSVLNGSYPGSNINTHGVLILNGATLNNAITLANSRHGGVIYCNNTNIDYCAKSFDFDDYTKSSLVSRIENTTITYRQHNYNANAPSLVYGRNAYNASFHNVTFNVPSQYSKQYYAIITEDAGFKISNCTFNNFYVAIQQQGILSTIRRMTSINNCNFTNNEIGLNCLGNDYIIVENNTFTPTILNNVNNDLGLKFDGATGYKCSNNTFKDYSDSNTLSSSALKVINSGEIGNKINHNTFINNNTSIDCNLDNRGLQLVCNTFFSTQNNLNTRNISVFGLPWYPITEMGIPNQGAEIDNDIIGLYLPNNLFSHQCAANQPGDIEVANDYVPYFDYFYRNPQTEPENQPICFTSPEVTTKLSMFAQHNLRPQACQLQSNNPSNVIEIMGEKQNLKNQLLVLQPIGYEEQITYLTQSIEADVFEIARVYTNDENWTQLIQFLTTNITPQKRMIYIQYLIDIGNYNDALNQLNILSPITINDDVTLFKNYYTKLAQLLVEGSDLTNLSLSDITYFEQIAASASPTAAKAQNLLNKVNSSDLFNGLANNLKSNTVLNIYPNPANTVIKADGMVEFSTYIIYDQIMRVVKQGRIENNEIQVSDLANGVYFINLSNKEETVIQKIVINH